MLLLLIKNIAKMPSFIKYTENWKTDFFSNAVEKTILYMHNFDENILSKRTAKEPKAFAYITQICYNAFIEVINTRKTEEKFLDETISLENMNVDSIYDNKKHNESSYKKPRRTYFLTKDQIGGNLKNRIKEAISYIEEQNEIINNNRYIEQEIDRLESCTPENEKNMYRKDYNNYIEELKEKMNTQELDEKYTEVVIEKYENEILPIDYQIQHTYLDVVITNNLEKIKNKENGENILDEGKLKEDYMEFFKEW